MKAYTISVLMLLTGVASTAGVAASLPGPLVETDWLAKNLGKVTVLDVRKDVKSFTRKPLYIKNKKTGKRQLARVGGHIPGALLVNYKKVRVKRKIGGKTVTRLAPTREQFEKLMQDSGLKKNAIVVIVSKGQSNGDVTMATRLYWQLKYFGHGQIAILNGGMAQWILDKRKVETAATKPARGDWVVGKLNKSVLATGKDVAAAMKDGKTVLIDNRSLSQYLGTFTKSYVYADGHIPGAKVFPNELMTRVKMPAKFLTLKQYRKLHAELKIDAKKPAITYCNSGHLATGSWFIRSELLGNKNTSMYDGSMHQWTMEKRKTTKMKME